MKKYISIISVFITCLGMLTVGCKKQLEISPQQSIDANIALNTRGGIEASITSVYATLKSARLYGRDLITHPEALADNGFATNKSGRLLPEAQNNFGAHFTTIIWSSCYRAINQINLTLAAIPALPEAPAPTATEINRWEGQLLFLRGLCHFILVEVYSYMPGAVVTAQDKGGVIIAIDPISTGDAAQNWKPARAPLTDVYNRIVTDLTDANSRLLNPGLGANLANKAAAQGLLARVNLYRKNFSEAKRWADSCINIAGTRITTTSNHVSNWRADTHGESLFQIRFATSAENIGVNESLQTSFSTLVTPGNPAALGGFGDLVPSLTMLTDLGIALQGGMTTGNFAVNAVVASRSTDVRNLLYEPGSTGRGPSKVECTKFLGKSGFINLDNVPVIRIAEVYLIRAEAQAEASSSVLSLPAALADLKTLKTRRYTDYTGSAQETADNAATQAQLFEEILRQRRIELAFEGHRFFDIKRLGRDLPKAPHYTLVPFADRRILPALPTADIDFNSNLQQNFGY
jgi:starch-binding outer membrane protein, SusD/RagB family